MLIEVRGRPVDGTATPVRGGYFLRCSVWESHPIWPGQVVELDGRPHVVRHVLRFPGGEPECWAIAYPAGTTSGAGQSGGARRIESGRTSSRVTG